VPNWNAGRSLEVYRLSGRSYVMVVFFENVTLSLDFELYLHSTFKTLSTVLHIKLLNMVLALMLMLTLTSTFHPLFAKFFSVIGATTVADFDDDEVAAAGRGCER
jgi:hypothetical protein